MKKALSLILALVLCLSLFACGKSDAVLNCEKQIENLGNITLDNRSAIEYARIAYDGLSEKEQRKVSNYEKLTNAEAEYNRLLDELNTKVEALLATEPNAETLDELRKLPDCDKTNNAIAVVSYKIFKEYITQGGTSADSFTFEVDGEYLKVINANSSSRVNAKSSFRLSSSESEIWFYSTGGGFFSRCDRFKYNKYDVCWISWTTHFSSASSKEKVSGLGMKISGGTGLQEWPYTQSEDTLNEIFSETTDADEFLEKLNNTLKRLGMPFSSWELAGLYDPDMH